MNARPIDSNKTQGATRREIIAVSLGVVAVVGLYGLAARQSIHAAPKVSVPVVGVWSSSDKPWRLVFRPDRTLDMSFDAASEAGKLVAGSYQLDATGWLKLKLENGKVFTTNLKAQNPTRFDLIDAADEGVTTFERAQ
jgi:hypothetical protein